MNKRPAGGVLGLFSEYGLHGGVQASGQVAWQGIIDCGLRIADCGFQATYFFCFGSKGKQIPLSFNGSQSSVYASSKIEAVVASLCQSWPVHTVFIWHLGLLKLLPFFRVPGARVVLFLHGIEVWKTQRLVNRILLNQVDLFLSNSDFTWRQFLRFNPSYESIPHRTIPLGIGELLKSDEPVPISAPVVLMISRLEKSEDYKGHREMINVWPQVLERVSDAELWIVGEGNLRGELERLARERAVQERVRFHGWVSEEKKQEMLAQCRCLALPSRGEGFGLVYLEAMRIGRPCLVSLVDAGREVVNPPEAGPAVDLAQPEQLVESLCELLTPGERWETWSANARRRYESLFTAKHFQNRLISAMFSPVG